MVSQQVQQNLAAGKSQNASCVPLIFTVQPFPLQQINTVRQEIASVPAAIPVDLTHTHTHTHARLLGGNVAEM